MSSRCNLLGLILAHHMTIELRTQRLDVTILGPSLLSGSHSGALYFELYTYRAF